MSSTIITECCGRASFTSAASTEIVSNEPACEKGGRKASGGTVFKRPHVYHYNTMLKHGSLSFTGQMIDFKCWISNTYELEGKPRLRRWFEETLSCKLDLYPFGRLPDQQ